MAVPNATLIAAMNCTTNVTEPAVSFASRGPGDIAIHFIARLIVEAFRIAELSTIATALIRLHGYIWPTHLRYIVNPDGTPRLLRPRRTFEVDHTGTPSVLRTVCDLGLSLAEIPIIMSVFAAFIGVYCLAGFLVWYFIPALRPTRLAYTAVCMGVESVKYVWPFVSAVIKETANEIAVISASEGPTLQQVMEREGFRLFQTKCKQFMVFLVDSALDHFDAVDWAEGLRRARHNVERSAAYLLSQVLSMMDCLDIRRYRVTAMQ